MNRKRMRLRARMSHVAGRFLAILVTMTMLLGMLPGDFGIGSQVEALAGETIKLSDIEKVDMSNIYFGCGTILKVGDVVSYEKGDITEIHVLDAKGMQNVMGYNYDDAINISVSSNVQGQGGSIEILGEYASGESRVSSDLWYGFVKDSIFYLYRGYKATLVTESLINATASFDIDEIASEKTNLTSGDLTLTIKLADSVENDDISAFVEKLAVMYTNCSISKNNLHRDGVTMVPQYSADYRTLTYTFQNFSGDVEIYVANDYDYSFTHSGQITIGTAYECTPGVTKILIDRAPAEDPTYDDGGMFEVYNYEGVIYHVCYNKSDSQLAQVMLPEKYPESYYSVLNSVTQNVKSDSTGTYAAGISVSYDSVRYRVVTLASSYEGTGVTTTDIVGSGFSYTYSGSKVACTKNWMVTNSWGKFILYDPDPTPQKYKLTVIDGVNKADNESSGNYAAGSKITVKPSMSYACAKFSKWTFNQPVTFSDNTTGKESTAEECTFTMPESALKATANFEHQHSWSFKNDGSNVIRAVCADDYKSDPCVTPQPFITVNASSVTYTGLTYTGFNMKYRYSSTPITDGKFPTLDIALTTTYTGQTNAGKNYSSTTAPTDAGAYKVTVTGGEKTGNVSAYKSFNITPVTISDVTLDTDSYIYDGDTHEPVVTVKATVNGEQKTLTKDEDYTISGTTSASALSGDDGYTITITGKGNYTGTVNKTWYISKTKMKDSDVTETNYSGVYDGKEHSATAAATAIPGAVVTYSESEDGTYTSESPAYKDAGTYMVYYKVTAEDYEDKTGTLSVSITKKPVSITWGSAELTYNGKNQAPKASVPANELVGTDTCGVIQLGTRKDVGTGYTTRATSLDNTNYKIADDAEQTKTFAIKAKEVTISWSDTELTYNGNEQLPTATVEGVISTDTCSVSVSGKQKNAGTYTATAAVLSNTNYTFAANADKDTEFTISPLKVTVTPAAAEKHIGASDPEFGYNVTGPVVEALTDISVVREAGEAPGEYKLTASQPEGANKNYDVTFAENTFVINDHTYGEWAVTKNPTADETGEKQRICSECQDVQTEEIPRLVLPVITKQPKDTETKSGDTATFTAGATGEDLRYQWQVDRGDGKGFVDIDGADSDSYTTSVVDEGVSGYKYHCVVSNKAGSVTTDTAVLSITKDATGDGGSDDKKDDKKDNPSDSGNKEDGGDSSPGTEESSTEEPSTEAVTEKSNDDTAAGTQPAAGTGGAEGTGGTGSTGADGTGSAAKTGDDSPVVWLFALMLVGGCGAYMCLEYKRSRRNNR